MQALVTTNSVVPTRSSPFSRSQLWILTYAFLVCFSSARADVLLHCVSVENEPAMTLRIDEMHNTLGYESTQPPDGGVGPSAYAGEKIKALMRTRGGKKLEVTIDRDGGLATISEYTPKSIIFWGGYWCKRTGRF